MLRNSELNPSPFHRMSRRKTQASERDSGSRESDAAPSAAATPAIREQAARWVVRMDDDAEDLSAEERAEFADWITSSPAHRDEFGAMMTIIAIAREIDPAAVAGAARGGEVPPPPKHERRLLLKAVIAPGPSTAEGTLVVDVVEPWFEIIEELCRDPSIMYRIGSRKWEELVAGAYWRSRFDEVILTSASGDRGRDVIAVKHGLGNVRVIDQVKAFKPGHLVTAHHVRVLLGVLHLDGASKCFLTTTSDFAPRLATDPLIGPLMPARLELVNGARLARRLREIAADRVRVASVKM